MMKRDQNGKGVFVVGTDTGVGKTYIACSIARGLEAAGLSVGVMKPVATGDRNDVRALMAAAGVRDPLDLANPVYLKRPLAALAAARLEQKTVDPGAIRKSFRALRRKYEYLVVEGAGGLMVPVTETVWMIDLAAEFRLPAVVVARPGLGTINHAVLTVDKLRQRRLKVLGIVLSGYRSRTLPERTNPGLLRELTGLPVACVGPGRSVDEELLSWLTDAPREKRMSR